MKTTKWSLLQLTLRGLVLALAVTALSSYVARATPYACQFFTNGTQVSFVLNQTAAGMTLITNGIKYPVLAPAAGTYSFDNTGVTSWSLWVTGATTKGWAQFIADGTDRNFEQCKGIAINRNPASTNFGKVYVSNARAASTAAGRACTDGIYVLRADGVALNGGAPYTGGLTWTSDGTRGTSPWRSTIGPDDHLYVVDYYDDWSYEFSDDMSTATQLSDANNRTANQWVYSMWVEGTKAAGNRKIYYVNYNYNDTARKGLIRYDLNAADTATASDTGTQVIGPGYYTYYPYDVTRDSQGYFYLNQYRATAGQVACVSKFDVSGTLPVNTAVWEASSAYTYTAGLDLHESSGRIAVSQDSAQNVYIFNKDTGAYIESFNASATGLTTGRPRDLAWDAAGNIVTIDNSREYARFWSRGGASLCVTRSDGTFSTYLPDVLQVTATTPNAYEEGTVPGVYTITRSGGPAGNLSVSYAMSGTASTTPGVDYNITPASPFIFEEGMTSTNITITPVDDTEREPTETAILTISASTSYDTLSPTAATVYIWDNDVKFQYWDTNGITAGASGDPNGIAPGTWGTDVFWSTDPAGAAATDAWYATNAAVFSAGSDAWGTFTVALNGAQSADYLSFEEGEVTLSGGTLTLTNFNGVQVASGLNAHIDSVLDGAAGFTMEGPGTVFLGGANTYSGTTLIKTGTVTLAASERIPDASALSLGAAGTLDLNGYSETVASLTGVAGGVLTVPGGQTFTYGNTANTTWSGTEGGGGTLIKLGTGTNTIGGLIADALDIRGGMVSINAYTRLTGPGNAITLDNNACLRSTSTAVGSDFVTPDRTFTINSGGGILRVNDSGAILFVRDGTVISGSGTLTKDGPGELRTYSVEHSFGKLIVSAGLYTAGHGTAYGYNTSFGGIPAAATADAITIYGGASIRKAGGQNVALDPKQGITLTGTGTKTIRAYAGDANCGTFDLASPIVGTGPLALPGPSDLAYAPIMILRGNNTYSGGTVVNPGWVYVINDFSISGTGSGSVGVTNSTLGGNGKIGGAMVVQTGYLSPGYAYYTGQAGSVTPVTQNIGRLLISGGLDLTHNSTNVWQLGALSVANPGTDWDQVEISGGVVTNNTTYSYLQIGTTGTAMGPTNALTDPFWQQNRTWKVMLLSGTAAWGGGTPRNITKIVGTNGWTGGTFTTTADATGINLNFTTKYAAPTPVTSMSVAAVGGGSATINYSGAAGNQFILMRTNALTGTVIVSRQGWEAVATNTVGSGSFTIPATGDTAFYYIKSE
jgi:autotransporter-associated beta strand protein